MDNENIYTLRYTRDWATKRKGQIEKNHDRSARDFLTRAGIAEDVTHEEIKPKRGRRKKRNNK